MTQNLNVTVCSSRDSRMLCQKHHVAPLALDRNMLVGTIL